MSLFKNSNVQYSVLAKMLHWLTAITVVFMFALGLWMAELDYYHAWYQRGPALHMGIGVTLALVTVLRLIYRVGSKYPEPLPSIPKRMQLAAHLAHAGLYGLLFVLFITGYFIVTAEGDPLSVFGLFEIPALINNKNNLQDWLGEVHEWVASILIILALIHGGAALWHHFKLRDGTLLRMITKAKQE
jgi:cytochrome b561